MLLVVVRLMGSFAMTGLVQLCENHPIPTHFAYEIGQLLEISSGELHV